DQPMDSRLALEVERVLHLLERGRNAGFLEPALDEEQKLVLLGGQHGQALRKRSNSGTNAEQVSNKILQVKRSRRLRAGRPEPPRRREPRPSRSAARSARWPGRAP